MNETLVDLLSRGDAQATALLTPGRAPLSYRLLRADIERLAGQLRALGINSDDAVALVLPNGPEAAIAFLAVASTATAAPLNPAYREEEFRFYLADLAVRALITLPGEGPAAHAAAPSGTIALSLEGEPGALRLTRDGAVIPPVGPTCGEPDDTALILHTSGTTARPKMVPLSHRNLTASAGNIVTSLYLTPEDRCLQLMPLFHIHGLVAGILAPLLAGGSVVCPPGFDAFQFVGWLDEFGPSWYTAVPTMHQLILARAERLPAGKLTGRLRFLRSSSASLPPVVMERLESLFGAPAIEAYGMTEAAHQMTTNPLPPGIRKPGAVGLGVGVQVGIMDESGSLLGPGGQGEVVVRGPNVMSGYRGNPEANAAAFQDGWFRTGDQGRLDDDGYLHLTGRLKELINRGGEKISPREVDDVLLRHPAVSQAVAFALPHERLGEDVAAAVVLREGAAATAKELRDHAARHLADFKVPRTIVIVREIPRGPTGKLIRIGLARKLGLAP